MLLATVLIWPIAAHVGDPQLRTIAHVGWLGIAALVVTASLVGFVSFVYMLQQLPAYVAGAYPYVNAVVAAGVSVLWLDERLSLRFYLSAILVLGGVALIQLPSRRSSA
jgi:drug/metabolite transporter (DMT)-like permease